MKPTAGRRTKMRESLSLRLLVMFGACFGVALWPAIGRADFIHFVEESKLIHPTQSINWTVNSGPDTTLVGDTNPAPVYNVDATLEAAPTLGDKLDGSGSTISTVSGNGFTSMSFYPDAGNNPQYAWTAFEFQLDSTQKTPSVTADTLSVTVTDYLGNTAHFVGSVAFPWEGNSGSNQHYLIYVDDPSLQSFSKVTLTYDPSGTGNTISDIHNIDVVPFGATIVPEPASLTLLGLGAVGLVGYSWRRRKSRAA